MPEKVERHEFEAEVKQILDIVVHSLYSNKDIFLRELISNGSDALDKLRFQGLTDSHLLPEGDLHIRIERDPDNRTVSVSDNGIGMSREEVMQNIGTIAKSGTTEFLAALEKSRSRQELTPELIGQFGVGFYSTFMVADRVSVVTRRAGEETATLWESAGDGWYRVDEAERDTAGTTVTLHLKIVDEENGIKDYVDEWVIRNIVKHYSDFVSYPILMKVERQEFDREADGSPKKGATPKLVVEDETLNSMKAIWTRPKGQVTDTEYNEFFKHLSHDWSDPLTHLSVRMEGAVDARALLFIPSHAPLDLYHQEMSYRGLQLYVKRIFIMDECRDLMPRHLRFIKGVVDAEDLSLNVSRELLQQDRQIVAIRKFLVRKIMEALAKLKDNEPEKYRTFWDQFGPVLKEGLLTPEDKPEAILDLMLCDSSNRETDPTTLVDYVSRMKEDQNEIYFMTGPSREVVERSPHIEGFLEQGYEVLFFADRVDDVWLQNPPPFQDRQWQSLGRGEVELGGEADRKKAEQALEEKTKSHKDLLALLQDILKEEVKEVRLTNRLTSSAACLVGDAHDLSPQLAELLSQLGQDVPKVKRILEINPSHPILERMQQRFDKDRSDAGIPTLAELLYGQTVLAEGGQLPDPAGFSKLVAELMVREG
jgi:molecular chaperone HtpG